MEIIFLALFAASVHFAKGGNTFCPNPQIWIQVWGCQTLLSRHIVTVMTDMGGILKGPEAQAELLNGLHDLPPRQRATHPNTAYSIGDDRHSGVYSLPALHWQHLKESRPRQSAPYDA